MTPTFDQYIEGSGAELECPACNGTNLHQAEIEVFEKQEGEATGLHVAVNAGEIKIDRNLARNPSAHRNGLRIGFTCEHCNAKPVLTVFQHKGQTYIDFLIARETPSK